MKFDPDWTEQERRAAINAANLRLTKAQEGLRVALHEMKDAAHDYADLLHLDACQPDQKGTAQEKSKGIITEKAQAAAPAAV